MGRPVNANLAKAAKLTKKLEGGTITKEERAALRYYVKIGALEMGVKRSATIHANDEPLYDPKDDPEPEGCPDPFNAASPAWTAWKARRDAYVAANPSAASEPVVAAPVRTPPPPAPIKVGPAPVAAPVFEVQEICAINDQPGEVAPVAPPAPVIAPMVKVPPVVPVVPKPAPRSARKVDTRSPNEKYWDGFSTLTNDEQRVRLGMATPAQMVHYRIMREREQYQIARQFPQPPARVSKPVYELTKDWGLPPMPPDKKLSSLTMTEALAPFAPCPPKGELPAPTEAPRAIGKLRLPTPIPPPDLTAG